MKLQTETLVYNVIVEDTDGETIRSMDMEVANEDGMVTQVLANVSWTVGGPIRIKTDHNQFVFVVNPKRVTVNFS